MSRRRGHGEGTIYQTAAGKWRVQVTLPGGQRASKTFPLRRDAQDWLIKTNKTIQDGLPVAASRITLAQFLDRWLADVVIHRVRPSTYQSYTVIVRVHLKPALGDLKLRSLRPDHIQRLFSESLAAGLSPTTVRYIHSTLRSALNQALRWGLVARNVATLADPPGRRHTEMHVLSPDQVRAFLDGARDNRLYPLYLLAITTGMRQGELLGLRWSDVDLGAGTIQVTHALQAIRGQGMRLTEPKSAAGRRLIKIGPTVAGALRAHRRHQLETRLQAGARWIDHDLVFSTNAGKLIAPRNLRRSFTALLKSLEIPHVRFHDLRHTAATLMLAQGTHPKVVQEMLGHSSISLTLNTYSHVLPTMQEEAAERMETFLAT